MMKLSFSSVAFPERPLREVARIAESVGARGVELRTFGSGSTEFACDPALSAPAKTARLFADAGVAISCISTSCRFDEPVSPPVIGRVFGDTEKQVRAARYAIDLAEALGAAFVRVFGFESPGGVLLESTTRMVVERLGKVADHARNRGVKVLLENGGSYQTAADLAGVIDRVGSPLLGAAYNVAVAAAAGEEPGHGFNVLGDNLWNVKLKDFRGALPCVLGQGDAPCREAVRVLSDGGYQGWLTYEYDHAWLSSGAEGVELPGDGSEMVRDSFAAVFRWLAEGRRATANARRAASVA